MIETIDDFFLDKFERVGKSINKKLGTDKYDLVHSCNTGAAIGMGGMGFYGMLSAYATGSGVGMVIGAAFGLGGVLVQTGSRIKCREERKAEMDLLVKYGAKKPIIWKERTNRLAQGFVGLSMLGVATLSYSGVVEVAIPENLVNMEPHQYRFAMEHFMTGLGLSLVGFSAASYFKSTTMDPPGTQRQSLWSRVKNYVGNFGKKTDAVPDASYEVLHG